MQYFSISKPSPVLPFNGTKITASKFDCSFNELIDIVKLESTSINTGTASAQITALIVAIIVIFGTATLFPFVIPFATKERYIAIVPFGTATECFLPTVFEIWSSRLPVILCSVIQEPLLKYFVTSSISCAVISGSI